METGEVPNEYTLLGHGHHGKGLTILSAAIFIAGEMAGSGVLALPRAAVDSGWIGIVLVVVFCINAGYAGSRLGACWSILEERYPHYRKPVRNPYPTIAFRVLGGWGQRVVSGCIQFTLFGAGTVYLLLASQIIKDLLNDLVPSIGYCIWFLVIGVLLAPAMWLGSPKDFSLVGLGALLTTAISCVLIFAQMVIDGSSSYNHAPRAADHGFRDFFLAFGTILFAYGGASTFPTIQNDMNDKSQFSKSVLIGFIVIICLYVPVTVTGYLAYGEVVASNVILSMDHTILVDLANVLMAIHLVLAFLIVINPVCQELEEFFQTPREFGTKRCLLRGLMMFTMVFVGETIPRFGKILSLVGGSTVTLLTFVFPPFFYLKLCDQNEPGWPTREIPLFIRVYLWELILIGLFGGTAATYSAILAIVSPDSFTTPCYWVFT